MQTRGEHANFMQKRPGPRNGSISEGKQYFHFSHASKLQPSESFHHDTLDQLLCANKALSQLSPSAQPEGNLTLTASAARCGANDQLFLAAQGIFPFTPHPPLTHVHTDTHTRLLFHVAPAECSVKRRSTFEPRGTTGSHRRQVSPISALANKPSAAVEICIATV